MSKSCKGLLQELVKCLRESDCIKVSTARPPLPRQGAAVQSWLARGVPRRAAAAACRLRDRRWHPHPHAAPESTPPHRDVPQKEGKDIKVCAVEAKECAGLRTSYFACKRGQLDPRNRIRGNKGF